jgi:hypothetical protein
MDFLFRCFFLFVFIRCLFCVILNRQTQKTTSKQRERELNFASRGVSPVSKLLTAHPPKHEDYFAVRWREESKKKLLERRIIVHSTVIIEICCLKYENVWQVLMEFKANGRLSQEDFMSLYMEIHLPQTKNARCNDEQIDIVSG